MNRLFKIITPERTYPLLADTADEVTSWLFTLNDLLGLAEEYVVVIIVAVCFCLFV